MIPAVMPTYARADVAFERGEGAYLFDTEGRRYLDFASGIAVTSLGHGHPHLVAALVGQAQLVWHTSNLFRVTGQEKLASRLVANSFADTVAAKFPMYVVRGLGGTMFLVGALIMAYNLWMTVRKGAAKADAPVAAPAE